MGHGDKESLDAALVAMNVFWRGKREKIALLKKFGWKRLQATVRYVSNLQSHTVLIPHLLPFIVRLCFFQAASTLASSSIPACGR